MKDRGADSIFNISNEAEFTKTALEVFHLQANENKIYREFINRLGKDKNAVEAPEDIPFLPVEFFRHHIIITGTKKPDLVFESSGTTGSVRSSHYISDISVYNSSITKCFRMFYGDPAGYLIAALMPSPAGRPSGSLSYMAGLLISSGADEGSGFFNHEYDRVAGLLTDALASGKRCMLFGLSHSLLDFAETAPVNLSGAVVVETGGMKGRRKEITREELHDRLMKGFGVTEIHSEYGMTELLSQAWSDGKGLFRCPPWMQVFVSELNDPQCVSKKPGATGAINIIDLANINSCAFLATRDLGRLKESGCFEVIGRYDHSDIRGCSLLAG